MSFFKFLQLQKDAENIPSKMDVLHLWEDDHLMIELLHVDNVDFVQRETKRINEFAEEHFDGNGFTDITPIGEKPFKTIEKLIDIYEVEKIMEQCGLKRVRQFYMQAIGLAEGDKAPLGFGTNKFAIICDSEGGILQHIWITGQTSQDTDKQKLINALSLFGKAHAFIGVNWYKGEYCSLNVLEEIEKFVRNSV